MAPLPEDRIIARLAEVPAWARVSDEIVRTYELSTFPEAIAFVTRVGDLAEAADHHPDIDIRWRKVRLALTTHDDGGLSDKDFDLATQCDVALTEGGSGAADS